MMIDCGHVDYLAQPGGGGASSSIVRRQCDVVPTNAQDTLLANILLSSDEVTGAPVIYVVLNDFAGKLNVVSASVSAQLLEIKEKFGLNLSQLSKVLNVSRPQLYKWLEGEAVPQRYEFNQKITDIYSLTSEIPHGHSKYFGKLAKRYTSDGITVLDALTDSNLDKDRLLAVYASIKSDIESIESRKASEVGKRRKYGDSEVILPPNDSVT
ncbi:MAG: hypothetical protein OQK32_05380 [Gammaproteobacteria bacterium]|nr:hypothetical protein [Gammaproteobacteria bacterium]